MYCPHELGVQVCTFPQVSVMVPQVLPAHGSVVTVHVQVPLVQVPPFPHAAPSLPGVSAGHMPVLGTQLPAIMQGLVELHGVVLPPLHDPFWHFSPVMHLLPLVQLIPVRGAGA